MKFYKNQMFHIYNQGNNGRQIFFSDENYTFFLWKMRESLLPFGDLIAWCLMPNHFHWLFYVRHIELKRKELREHADKIEWMRRVHKYGAKAQVVERDWSRNADENKPIFLNDTIGNLQKSYTRAINKERDWTGSLFREECKAKDGWIDEFVTLKKKDGKIDYRFLQGNDYAFQCLGYIHDNPKKAGMVKKSTDYQWSSARDYAGLRNGSICNLEMGKNLFGFI